MEARGRSLILWGVLLLAVALRLFNLGGQSFWIDEVYQLIDSSRPLAQTLAPYAELDLAGAEKSPLTFTLHHFLLGIGEGEFFLRLPSALFSVAEVAVLFFLVRALLGFQTAALAALLLAISPLHLWYAQEFRYYSLWSLLTTCTFFALVSAWRGGGLKAWIGYVGSLIAAAATFVITAFVVALHWLAGGLLWRRDATSASFRRGFAVVQGAGILLVAIPVLIRLFRGMPGPVGTPRDLEFLALPYTFFTFVAGFSAGPSIRELHLSPGAGEIFAGNPEVLLFLVVFAPLVLLGAWRLLTRSPAGEFLLPWALGLPVLVWGATAVLGNTYNVRYAFPALTAFTAVLAVGVCAVGRPRLRYAAAAAVVLCMGYSLVNYYFNPRYQKADVRSAVEHVRAGSFADAPVAVTGQVIVAVGYYGEGRLRPVRLWDCDRDGGDTLTVGRWEPNRKTFPDVQTHRNEFETAPHLWLLSGRDWRSLGDECLEWLEETHRVAERQEFAGVELYRLSRREDRPREPAAPAAGDGGSAHP